MKALKKRILNNNIYIYLDSEIKVSSVTAVAIPPGTHLFLYTSLFIYTRKFTRINLISLPATIHGQKKTKQHALLASCSAGTSAPPFSSASSTCKCCSPSKQNLLSRSPLSLSHQSVPPSPEMNFHISL